MQTSNFLGDYSDLRPSNGMISLKFSIEQRIKVHVNFKGQ